MYSHQKHIIYQFFLQHNFYSQSNKNMMGELEMKHKTTFRIVTEIPKCSFIIILPQLIASYETF